MLLSSPRCTLAEIERSLAHDDRLCPQHVVRVGLTEIRRDHMIEVAERLDGSALMILSEEQHLACYAHSGKQRRCALRPGSIPDIEGLHDPDLPLGGTCGQSATQREPLHLLRCPLAVVARLGSVRDTAANPLG